MCLLTVLVFDFIGMAIAGISGAAKGQGLAGGAIVFMYGLYTAVAALAFAVIFCYHADQRKVKTANKVLSVTFVLAAIFFVYRIYAINEDKDNSYRPSESKAKTIAVSNSVIEKKYYYDDETPLGLGFFRPDFHKNPKLYFYGDPNLEKSVQDHSPADSLVYKNLQEFSNYELIYAPPWLLPEHYKLDYDIFYLKILSVSGNFAEVILNNTTQQTGYVDRGAGEIIYWPDFLLKVFSVEFIPGQEQTIRFKPLDHSAEINTPFTIMKPVGS